MLRIRNLLAMILCLILLTSCIIPVAGAEQEEEQAIVRDMIAYYFHYRENAASEIENQLETLSSLNEEEGKLWRRLMTDWAWINEEMPVYSEILPDGLPEDDSLCIVVLGFGLKRDGSMKQELLDRLDVALFSAEKYPNAYVLCTGGETSDVSGVSEAGQMGQWLLEMGLDESRLILEDDSLSTTENAKNSLRILWQKYPQVSSIAIVSSDYHIRWGSAVFNAMASCSEVRQGEAPIALVGNAACTTASPDRDSMYSQAWGISIIADVPFDGEYVPTLYMQEETVEAKAQPAAEAAPVSEPIHTQPEAKEPVAAVLVGLAAVLLILFIPKKRKKSGSE